MDPRRGDPIPRSSGGPRRAGTGRGSGGDGTTAGAGAGAGAEEERGGRGGKG